MFNTSTISGNGGGGGDSLSLGVIITAAGSVHMNELSFAF